MTSRVAGVDSLLATGVRSPVFTGWAEILGKPGNPLNLKRVMPPQGVRIKWEVEFIETSQGAAAVVAAREPTNSFR